MTRSVDEDVLRYELAVVLVWCEHVCLHAHVSGLGGQSAYNVVGLEAVTLQYGYVECLKDFLDYWYG